MPTAYDERVDALLDSWLEERRRAERAEMARDALELAIGAVFEALARTTIAPTPELVAALESLSELIPGRT